MALFEPDWTVVRAYQVEFERIREQAKLAIVENTPNLTLVKDWKQQIRQILLQVKKEFNEWIEILTNKFVNSLRKIEDAPDLKQYANNDRQVRDKIL